MNKLTAIIVDDEEFARENLKMLLEENCPEIDVIATSGNINEAKKQIEELTPQVVFQDIRMPSGVEGLELIESIPNKKFQVVFVTAFEEFAVRAFNSNAIHYILKPIEIDELKNAVDKLIDFYKRAAKHPEDFSSYVTSLQEVMSNYKSKKSSNRITINHTKGIKIIEDDEIMRLEADGNCTTLFFDKKDKYLDTRTLKVYENLLESSKFCRIHKSHIINLSYLTDYLKDDGHVAVMKDGAKVPISRDKLSDFLDQLKQL